MRPSLVAAALASTCLALSAGSALADQGALIHPVTNQTIIFVPKLIHPWYEAVKAGAKFAVAEEKKQGIDVNVIWDEPPQADVSDQNQRIENDISRHPSALVVSCLDPATNTQILDEATKAGVNVLTFNSFCADRFPFVGEKDPYQDAYTLADYLAKEVGDKGNVGILTGSLTAPDHVRRVQGFKDALKKYPNMHIVFQEPDNDDLDKAVSITESALQAHPDLVGILCSNASNPVGAARAVKNAGKAGKVHIVGVDDLPETLSFIREGVIDATMAQRQWDQGYWSVIYAVAKNEGHTLPVDHETGTRMVTKANVGS